MKEKTHRRQGFQSFALALRVTALFFVLTSDALSGGTTSRTNLQAMKPLASASILGVTTCASSACHGSAFAESASPLHKSPIERNEFTVWSQEDPHSRAFDVLLNERSQKMASRLGLASASSANECLSCHATATSENTRGPRFSFKEGVSCEACHGPAEKYVKSHIKEPQANFKNGMIPLHQPLVRAQTCLRCHMENTETATHAKLFGAGHPRLSFELETYSTTQPAHYRIDNDYRERKGTFSSLYLWFIGQWTRAKKQATVLGSSEVAADFSQAYCVSCHHSLDENRWQSPQDSTGDIPLNLSSFWMLEIAVRSLHLSALESLHAALRSTLKIGLMTKPLQAASAVLATTMDSVAADSAIMKQIAHALSAATLLRALVEFAENSAEMRHFEVGEQVAMAVASVAAEMARQELHPHPERAKAYLLSADRIIQTVDTSSRYSADALKKAITAMR